MSKRDANKKQESIHIDRTDRPWQSTEPLASNGWHQSEVVDDGDSWLLCSSGRGMRRSDGRWRGISGRSWWFSRGPLGRGRGRRRRLAGRGRGGHRTAPLQGAPCRARSSWAALLPLPPSIGISPTAPRLLPPATNLWINQSYTKSRYDLSIKRDETTFYEILLLNISSQSPCSMQDDFVRMACGDLSQRGLTSSIARSLTPAITSYPQIGRSREARGGEKK